MPKKTTSLLLGTQLYKTKKSMHEHRTLIATQTKLNVHPRPYTREGQTIMLRPIENESYLDFLHDLYQCHPEYPKWMKNLDNTPIGFYIGFYAGDSQAYFVQTKGNGIWVFSAKKCIDGEPTYYFKLMQALRNDIADQKNDYRKTFNGQYVCAITGVKLEPIETHVDHYEPQFIQIVGMWLDSINKITTDIEITGDGTPNRTIMNAELRESWKDFHRKTAVLRIISRDENLNRDKLKLDARFKASVVKSDKLMAGYAKKELENNAKKEIEERNRLQAERFARVEFELAARKEAERLYQERQMAQRESEIAVKDAELFKDTDYPKAKPNETSEEREERFLEIQKIIAETGIVVYH